MSDIHTDPAHGIAIIGLAGRFPGSPSLERFWQNLRDGVECITFFSDEELLAAGVDPAELADPLYVRARATLDGVEMFDSAFFGFTPREAEILDPQHRLFLECAWEALEDAGCDPDRAAGRIAVFGGAGASAYLLHNLLPNRELLAKLGSLQALLMNEGDFLTTRVSYKLNLKGPSVDVQTACSTSLVAVHMACQSLLAGESDLALAGGVSVDVPQANGYLYQEASVMSPDGHCRSFDERAAGTVNGSGVGIVALKRLADALADGDRIHAVILGSAINNDGSAKVGYTAPSVEGQSEAIAEALLMAGVEPDTIGYVEAHGSATPLGDPVEIEALTQAFRGGTDRSGFCAVGSVKSNIGHCNSAAGIAGLTKAVLALEHGEIPPSLGFERPNPQIDFASSPFYVASRRAGWPANGTPRRAGVSSFGLGGTNAHAVLEEAPPREPSAPASRPAQLLAVSARTASALEAAAVNLAGRLRDGSEDRLEDIAWTLQTGRKALDHRRIVVARDREEAAAALLDPKRSASGRREGPPQRPVVFLFPGLGDQYVDMARELYEVEPLFRETVDLCAERLQPELGLDLRSVIFSGEAVRPAAKPSNGPDLRAMLRRGSEEQDPAAARLAETAVAQPAFFVIEYALAQLLISWGIRPQAMIGYSIGEYVAACVAGVLNLEDALILVARRAKLIQELPAGAMLAVPLAEEEVRPLLTDERLSVSATNGPHFCVVGGPREALEELETKLRERNASCIFLQTTHAFHSAMMEPAVARFIEVAESVEMRPPEIPYLSNVTGTWITEEDLADPAYWARHMRGTVRFAEGLAELLASPERVLLEVGPGGTLGTLARQHPAAAEGLVTVPALRRGSEERSDVDFLLEAVGRLWIAGVPVDWEGLHGGERRLRVALPSYPFERQRCWIDPPSRAAAARLGAALPPAEPGVVADVPKADLADWLWVPAWLQAPPARLSAGASPANGHPESWLVFLDRFGLGERLAVRLRAEGHTVTTVAAGEETRDLGDGAWVLDPTSRPGYDALVKQLHGTAMPARIAHLWGVMDGEPSYDEAQRTGLLSLVFLEQALTGVGAKDGGDVRIGMVTTGVHDVIDGDRVIPAKATVLAGCKVIHQESARLTCTAIDITLPPAGTPAEERLFDQLLAELELPESKLEPVVAYRGRQRWVRRHEQARLPAATPAASRLRTGGVYLITDGMHGIGLGAAEYLARAANARVALVVPPDFPPRGKWEGWETVPAAPPGQDVVGTAVRRLLPLAALPEVEVVWADIADPAGMRAALDHAREAFGPVNGVLHAPGSFMGGLIQLKTPEGLASTLRPAAGGTEALFAALAEGGHRPDFVALMASTLTFTGGLGQLDIAAAGAYLDAVAQLRAAGGEEPFTLAVHWDPYQWDGWLAAGTAALPGLQPEQLQQDLAAYSSSWEQSGEAFRRLLACPLPRAIVTARDLQALIAETDAFTTEVFMAQMEKAQHGPARGREGLPTAYVEPRTDLEHQVAAIWEELFGIRPVGIEDNFLELGGHSLLAIQMATQLRNAFAVDLPVTVLFEAPTVGELAAAIEREQKGGEDPEELEKLLALVEGLSPDEALQRMQELGLSPEEVLS